MTGSTAAFGNIAAAVIGNTSAFITGSTSVIGNISAGTVNAPVIGNTATFVTGSTAAFGNITAGNIGNVGAVVTAGTINTNTINAGAVNSPVVGNTASFHTGSTAAFGNISAVNFGNAGATVTASTIQAGNISVTTTGNIYIANTGVSTSPTTGVLTVAGGVGINSNINVNNGATFNYAQSTSSASIVTIRGASDSALFVATPGANGYDGVVIGGQGNALPQGGVSLKVGGTGAMMVPVGGSGQTPGLTGNVDVLGMIRYDTGLQSLAYYNGSVWASIGGAFTVIQDAQYNGDGANVAYTLSSFGNANVTTNSTLVSINGVIQIPGSAYSVNFNSGTSTLTFTEAPAVGDLIDVRYYTASASVTNINNGYLAFDVNSTNYANISTGNTISLSTPRITVDNDGHVGLVNGSKLTYNQGNLNIAANNVSYIVDTFYQTAFTSAKYIVQAKNSNGGTGNVETHEAMVITDGAGTAHITVYGTINMGYSMGALGVTIAGGNVNLTYTSVTSAGVNANVKVYSNYIV